MQDRKVSIRKKDLDRAVDEAKRFLAAADAVDQCCCLLYGENNDLYYFCGQDCVAVKRASMDLSRALVGVRR